MQCSLTALPPNYLRFNHDTFLVQIPTVIHNERLVTWLNLHGKTEKRKDHITYTIETAAAFIEKKPVHAPWTNKSPTYKNVCLKEVKAKFDDLHIKQGKDIYEHERHTVYFEALRYRSHQNIRSIQKHHKHHRDFNGKINYPGNLKQSLAETIKLYDGESLDLLIRKVKRKYKRPFILVNFTDEDSTNFHAQLSLISDTLKALSSFHEDLKVVLIDVCTRNAKGEKLNQDVFHQYYEKTPESWGKRARPFSMVMFRPFAKLAKRKYRKFKTLYFDLMEGCENESVTDNTMNYRRNRDLLIHEMCAAGACASSQVNILVKDLRGMSKEKADQVVRVLSWSAVVVCTYIEDQSINDKLYSCFRPFFGYPYLVMVKMDGDPDKVKISAGVHNKRYTIDDQEDIQTCIELFYDHTILMKTPGNQTIKSGYAPFEMYFNPDIIKAWNSRAHIPSVV
jgi:hypothetical protein